MNNGNPDGNPNPNIAKAGEATQFGKGQDPREAVKGKNKPWAVRRAIKRLMGAVLPNDAKITPDYLAQKVFGREKELSNAERLAARKLALALAGNVKAMQQIEDACDGKLVERKITAKAATLEELVTGKANGDDDDDEE